MDRAACALRLAGARSTLQLARLTRLFLDGKAWKPFGYSQLEDYTRERLGRSGRWLRDLAALQAGLDVLPGLAAALLGRDGARPLGRVAALWISRTAGPESLAAWLDLARHRTVRELRTAVHDARIAGSRWPVAASDCNNSSLLVGDDLIETCVGRIRVPAAIRVAFDEVLELHRAVCGHEASVMSFVDALAAEAEPGPIPEDVELEPLRAAKRRRETEERLARAHRSWELDEESGEAGDVELAPFDETDLAELDRQLRKQVDLEDEIERRLCQLLAEMNARRAWRELGFASLGHYGEERLGYARRTVETRAGLARALERRPLLRAAYESGRVGQEAALLVLRALEGAPTDARFERAWVEHASAVTVKRLRDDLRFVARRSVGEAEGRDASAGLPPSDADWHASLFRAPGTTRARLARLGQIAIDAPEAKACLTFRLPEDVASRFFGAVEGARLSLQGNENERDAASCRAAQLFSKRGESVPSWVGLLLVLENYADVWDRAELVPKRRWDGTYRRDAYRCMAPACTSRKGLQNHHVHYRSRLGSNRLDNQINLCWPHHQEGEHGNLARVRGVAPLGLTWRLGRKDLATWFRNERRLDR